MTLRQTFFSGVIICISSAAFAQQDVQFTQYYNNKIGFNPGVAGYSDAICLNLGNRSQWVGFDDAPVSQAINANIPLSILHGGLLVSIVNDQIGVFQDISAALGYAYQMDLGAGKLGIGLAIDFRNKNVKSANWIYPDGTAGASDPSILRAGDAMTPELNFGMHYGTPLWYAGLSTSRMLQSEARFPGQTARYKSKMHYYLTGGMHIELPDYGITISPSTLLKSDLNSNLTLDLSLTAELRGKIFAGLGYRNQDAMSLMMGYQIMPDLRACYSYDITTSPLAAYSSGSHEVFFNYCFNIEVKPRINGSYRNPIFL